ncbi:TPA: hypothetical protein ACX6RZ_003312 [Photobacterium damselae]
MKVCMIEDSQQKAEKIISFLRSKFAVEDIYCFGSYQSGLKFIKKENPELIILDMTLPTFDRIAGKREGRMRPFGGVDIMRKMQLKGIKSKIIVVTQFSVFDDGEERVDFKTLFSRCKSDFGDIFIGSVKYSHSSESWLDELNVFIKKAL